MTNKEAYRIICNMLNDANVSDICKVALWKAEYVFNKLIRMEADLAEGYVDLLDIDYPRRDDYWDGYNTGYHDCEVEQQAKQAEGEKKDETNN